MYVHKKVQKSTQETINCGYLQDNDWEQWKKQAPVVFILYSLYRLTFYYEHVPTL